MVRTRFGGSRGGAAHADARPTRARWSRTSRLEEDPRLKTIWAGYAFAVDFREERGHAYMLDDQTFTERQQVVKQPGTCMNCHASVYTTYKKLGDGDLVKGFEAINAMPYAEARTPRRAPGGVHRLPRPGDHAAAHHPARRSWRGCGRSRRRRASPTTTSTATRPARRCAPSCAASATSSTTSRARRSASSTRGRRASRSRTSRRTTTRSATRTGPTPTPARRRSRRSTRSSRCGTRGSTPAPASPAPTATCRTPASGRSRSPTTTSARRCSTSTRRARPATTSPRPSSRARAEDDPGAHLRACATRRWTRSSR